MPDKKLLKTAIAACDTLMSTDNNNTRYRIEVQYTAHEEYLLFKAGTKEFYQKLNNTHQKQSRRK